MVKRNVSDVILMLVLENLYLYIKSVKKSFAGPFLYLDNVKSKICNFVHISSL